VKTPTKVATTRVHETNKAVYATCLNSVQWGQQSDKNFGNESWLAIDSAADAHMEDSRPRVKVLKVEWWLAYDPDRVHQGCKGLGQSGVNGWWRKTG
jgi:hypothetical protein